MTPTEFCYWLQGYFELNGGAPVGLSAVQANIVANHLALVFQHSIDPAAEPDPAKAAALQATHDGAKPPARPPKSPDPTIVYRC